MQESMDAVTAALRHQCCAEAQVSWYLHLGYYGHAFSWGKGIDDHDHHPMCCEVINGVHTPVINRSYVPSRYKS